MVFPFGLSGSSSLVEQFIIIIVWPNGRYDIVITHNNVLHCNYKFTVWMGHGSLNWFRRARTKFELASGNSRFLAWFFFFWFFSNGGFWEERLRSEQFEVNRFLTKFQPLWIHAKKYWNQMEPMLAFWPALHGKSIR